MPRRAGEVVGNESWVKDEKTGEMMMKTDRTHLNNDGRYLQACVWYGFLFGEKPQEIKYVPNNIREDAGGAFPDLRSGSSGNVSTGEKVIR